MPLYLIAGPVAEPVTVADAKLHCRIDGDVEDTLVASLILAARLHIERSLAVALIRQRWTLVLDAWPPGDIPLPLSPVIAVDSVRVGAAVVSPAQYTLLGGTRPAVRPLGFLPPPAAADGIEIAFTAGFGDTADDVPMPIRLAIRMLVAHWYEGREPGVGGTPQPVEALTAPYRRVRL